MIKKYFFENDIIEFDFQDMIKEYNLTKSTTLEEYVEAVEDVLNVYLDDFSLLARDKVIIDLYNYVHR